MVFKVMLGLLIIGLFVMLVKAFRKEVLIENDEADLKGELKDAKLSLRKHEIKSDVLDVEEDIQYVEKDNTKRETKLRK